MEKEIEIDWKGEKAKVIIKRLSFGERNDLIDQFMKMRLVGSQTVTEISYKEMIELALLKSIKSAPFTIDREGIRNLDPEVGDQIYAEVDALNRLSQIKKES